MDNHNEIRIIKRTEVRYDKRLTLAQSLKPGAKVNTKDETMFKTLGLWIILLANQAN